MKAYAAHRYVDAAIGPTPGQSLELPIDEVVRRGRLHPPYGEQVLDDLTREEAEAFLVAVLS